MAASYSYLRRKGRTALAVMPYSAEIVDWVHYSSPYSRFWDQPLVRLDRFLNVFSAIHQCCWHRQTAGMETLCFCLSMLPCILEPLGTALNPNTTANRELPSTPFFDLRHVSHWIIFFWRFWSDIVVSIITDDQDISSLEIYAGYFALS